MARIIESPVITRQTSGTTVVPSFGALSFVADAATIRHAATTYSLVFGECVERYTGLAEKATRHVSDIQTLMEAGSR